ncbi:GNAT family N-acetyltransferase [Pseudomonas sp. NFACC44-2]|uniref:GNAT family N-acetyltransferase n=1 Tax=unclassified Pseudomonas TaxID=196821 RepID=UPI003531675F
MGLRYRIRCNLERADRQLVGVGGLSADPFTHTRTGRLRRVYATPASRRQQFGRRLVSALLAHAALHFESVRLYTDPSE